MNHVALIPARAGSKSIINKNLQRLGSHTIVDRAISSAKSFGKFSKIILSTDIQCLVDQYLGSSEVILRPRPEALCTDDALMRDVLLDAIDALKLPADAWIWILQPTSPFRKQSDYHHIEELLSLRGTGSVISVKPVGAHHPNRCYSIKMRSLYPIGYTNFKNKQDLDLIYTRSGNYYVVQCGRFKKQKDFYLKKCRPFVVSEKDGINIDNEMDLLLARAIFNE